MELLQVSSLIGRQQGMLLTFPEFPGPIPVEVIGHAYLRILSPLHVVLTLSKREQIVLCIQCYRMIKNGVLDGRGWGWYIFVGCCFLLLWGNAAIGNEKTECTPRDYEARAHQLSQAGEVQAAIRELIDGRERHPTSAKLSMDLATNLYKLGRDHYESALEEYHRSLDLIDSGEEPDKAYAIKMKSKVLTLIAVLYRRLDDKSKAVQWLEKSIDYQPSHDAHYQLAMMHALAGKFVTSTIELAKAMEFSALDSDFRLLATLLSASGHWVLLEQFMQRCIQVIW
jgi:tetratricopeptide (TPR) repeat protein